MEQLQTAMDRAAIGFSVLCAAHCVLMPLVILLLPAVASSSLAGEGLHKLMILGAVPASLIALSSGCRKHRKWSVGALGVVGLAVLVGAALAGHEVFGETGEKMATLVGAGIVASGHLFNQRLCSKLNCQV